MALSFADGSLSFCLTGSGTTISVDGVRSAGIIT